MKGVTTLVNAKEDSIDWSLFIEAEIKVSKERIEELLKEFNLFQGCKTREDKISRLIELKGTIVF